MKDYKRLTQKEKAKLKLYKKSKKAAKKGLKWSLVAIGIFGVLAVGVIAFYKTLDAPHEQNEDIATTASLQNKDSENPEDAQNLDALSKNELETQSQTASKADMVGNSGGGADASSEKFYDFSKWNSSCNGNIIVINKDNSLPSIFSVKTKVCHGKEVSVSVFDDFENMISDAKKDGINLWVASGYRNRELQTKLFNRQVEREKSKAVITQQEAESRAARVVARPGTSEHNTGLAVDLNGVEDNFYTTKEYTWLVNNAHKYGFIERYPKKCVQHTGVIYEPWHFRYVGKDYAAKIKESGLCLEKYAEKYFV